MKVLYFSWLAERLGCPEETIEENLASADDLRMFLQQKYPNQRAVLADRHALRVAVNHQLVDWNHPINSTDEVAIFPPMTGG